MNIIFVILLSIYGIFAADPPYGQLSVKGSQLVGSDGKPVQLRGMSMYWSQWMPQWWTDDTVEAAKCCFNSNVIRATMAVDFDGYLTHPDEELKKLDIIVQEAIKLGIYVLIDWHTDSTFQAQAVEFFGKMAKKYAGVSNVLYEDYNEPRKVDWDKDLVPYHTAVVNAIRESDKKNVIILGTPEWSQDVDVAAKNPVKGDNLMYTLHYYSGTHTQWLRDKAQAAIDKGLPIFITEYGTCTADEKGTFTKDEAEAWYKFSEKNKLSYINWALDDKKENAAAFKPGTKPVLAEMCKDSNLTQSGNFVQDYYKALDNGVKCGAKTTGSTTPAPPTTPLMPTTSTLPKKMSA
uniref:Glycoside hydrolase family 5 domain-containing protein n=1 Tax=Ditylenchus dipsaci TaxID=166011 RepID=A0A915E2N8_9BILA